MSDALDREVTEWHDEDPYFCRLCGHQVSTENCRDCHDAACTGFDGADGALCCACSWERERRAPL